VAWLKLLNPLIEGFALSRSLEWRSLQRHRLPFFPDSIDHGWNCLTQRGSRGLSSLSIFRKQVIEQDDVSGDLIDFTLTCVIGTLRARDQKPKHKSGQCRYHPMLSFTTSLESELRWPSGNILWMTLLH